MDAADEQIEQLLREAEERLSLKAAQPSKPEQLDEVSLEVYSKDARIKIPQLRAGSLPRPYVQSAGGVAHVDPSRLVAREQRQLADRPRRIEDPIVIKEKLKKQKTATAGPAWFNLPRTDLTPELKRDIQLLRMRSVLDPKRHYKKEGSGKKSSIPSYSQVGTIIEGPTEFLNGRIPNKQRKRTFVEEVLANAEAQKRYKDKYNDIQMSKSSGRKAYYKQLKAKRAKIRK